MSGTSPGRALDGSLVADALLHAGFGPFAGVPCSYLGPLISVLQQDHPGSYVTAANEGEAVAIAAGSQLAGRRPAVILQNSGLGNAVNPLTSLCQTLRIPVLLLVTWRGRPGQPDEPQHELMGRATPDLLTSMEIDHEVFPATSADLDSALRRAARHLDDTGRPYAFIVPKGALAPRTARTAEPGSHLMLRAEAIARITDAAGPEALLVATTGKTARELERDRDRPGNLYVVGSMGCAASIGLGVALSAPARRVVVLDGDGAALMRLEAMATIGNQAPGNLLHVVLDNAAYESTGSQATVSTTVDFCAVATACGYRTTADVSTGADLDTALALAGTREGPHLIRVRIRPGSDPRLGRPALAPPEAAQRFRKALSS